MNSYFGIRRKGSRQRGIALLELGIFLPIYLVILTMVIDLGRQFARYSQLSAICYEGLRQLTQERELEIGRYSEVDAESKPTHFKVQEKLRQLVELNRSRIPSEVSIITERDGENVIIEVTTTYEPLMLLFGGIKVVKTVMVGPYLYA